MARSKLEKQKAKKGFRIFLRHVLKYKRTLVLLSIFSVLMAVIDGAVPFISGRFFDAILASNSINIPIFNKVPLWAFFLGVWAVFQVLTRIFSYYFEHISMNFKIIISDDYVVGGMEKIAHLPMRFHQDNKLGDTADRIKTAADKLNNGIEFVVQVSAYVLGAMVGIFFVFSINYILGAVMSVIVFVYIIVMLRVMKPLPKIEEEGCRMNSESFGDFYDALGNIKIVKQNGSEKFELGRFSKKLVDGAQRLFSRANKIHANSFALQGFAFFLIQFLFFLISVYYIKLGRMTLGELFAVNGYLMMAFWPFNYFVRWWGWLQKSFISLERAEKIFGAEEENYVPDSRINPKGIDGNIKFQNVDFKYKDSKNQKSNDVLLGVSFDIKQGETVAIVGESGVGKTTIADLISGFYFPQKGKILVDGIPTDKMPLHFLRKNIAVVSQDITIFNESSKYNIKYGNFGVSDEKVIEAAKEAGAHEFISKFKKKYNQKVGERGVKLSGGQRQRVAIAQAILKKAPILILDEPTSALDARTEKIVTESLEKLMEGRTTIIIAHRLSTVRKADKIIVLDKGKVVEIGKHDDLIKNKRGVYRKFYEVQKL